MSYVNPDLASIPPDLTSIPAPAPAAEMRGAREPEKCAARGLSAPRHPGLI